MTNSLFNSCYPKRCENGKLISISHVEYDFQNIPMGPGDKDSLDNNVVQVYIQGKVSFDAVKKSINNDIYFFRDRTECICCLFF